MPAVKKSTAIVYALVAPLALVTFVLACVIGALSGAYALMGCAVSIDWQQLCLIAAGTLLVLYPTLGVWVYRRLTSSN